MDLADIIDEFMNFRNEAAETAKDHCARAGLHGLTHMLVDRKILSESRGRYIVTLLAKAPPDPFETMMIIDFGKRFSLAELTLSPEECWPECFLGITPERKKKLEQEHIEIKSIWELEEAEAERLLEIALREGWDVLEAHRRYPNAPLFLGALARRIGRGDQLRQIYGNDAWWWAEQLFREEVNG